MENTTNSCFYHKDIIFFLKIIFFFSGEVQKEFQEWFSAQFCNQGTQSVSSLYSTIFNLLVLCPQTWSSVAEHGCQAPDITPIRRAGRRGKGESESLTSSPFDKETKSSQSPSAYWLYSYVATPSGGGMWGDIKLSPSSSLGDLQGRERQGITVGSSSC